MLGIVYNKNNIINIFVCLTRIKRITFQCYYCNYVYKQFKIMETLYLKCVGLQLADFISTLYKSLNSLYISTKIKAKQNKLTSVTNTRVNRRYFFVKVIESKLVSIILEEV